MEMIVGGAYQGKTRYARNLFPDIQWVDGGSCARETLETCEGILRFQEYIRRGLKEGWDLYRLTEDLADRNPKLVIVTDEIGCGIVPADPFEREYREQTGRICTRLAAEARRVHRVICGIGTVIKE